MNCEILRTIYLRANTEIPCNACAGERVNLGWARAAPDWSATQLFNEGRFRQITEALANGEPPWGDVCRRCVFLRPDEPFDDGLAAKRLEKVHVEPSMACAIRCPGCQRTQEITQRRGAVFLPVATYRRMLRSLAEEGFSVGVFFFCGKGEPLAHPELAELIRATREFFPTTPIEINTNGNYRYAEVFPVGAEPDKLIVSVDGVHQASYEKYRINGQVALALAFMSDAKKSKGMPPAVEWKYILFCHNDSDEELVAAQLRAEEIGVDGLLFVLTHTVEQSTRFTPENLQRLPIVSPVAYVETTPQIDRKQPIAQPLSATNSQLAANFSGAGRVYCCVDECRCGSGRLYLRGWAMTRDGRLLRALRVSVDGRVVGAARLGLSREDVRNAFPGIGNRHAGFRATAQLEETAVSAQLELGMAFETMEGETHTFTIRYRILEPVELELEVVRA